MKQDVIGFAAESNLLPWSLRRVAVAKRMANASVEDLQSRVKVIDYAHIRVRHRRGRAGDLGPIWQFWAQGETAAPPIVRGCLESVYGHAGRRERILLDARSIHDVLALPTSLTVRIEHLGWTFFSDLLRLMLLERYGGTWIDATVMLTSPLPDWLEPLDFFTFKHDHNPKVVANWFIHARTGNTLLRTMAAAYREFWLRRSDKEHYFAFHHIFEAILLSNAAAARAWAAMPSHPATGRDLFHRAYAEPFSLDRFDAIAAASWIHKLSYKNIAPDVLASTDSFYAVLSRGLPPERRPGPP